MDRALITLDESIQRVTRTLSEAEEYDEKLGSHLAWVTGKVAEITTSLRQLEKHDRSMGKTPQQRFALVCEYIRDEIDPGQRAQLRQLLDGLEMEQRVLS